MGNQLESNENTGRYRALAVHPSEEPVQSPFLSREEDIEMHGLKLPHWNQQGTSVFFTFRLKDSLPVAKQEELKYKKKLWLEAHPKPWSKETEKEYHKNFSYRIEQLLDKGYGSCFLKNKEAAHIVNDTMMHDHGKSYQIIDHVIMPNHVHALVQLIGETKVERIMAEWKSISSHMFRKKYGAAWCGWMQNYYDRIIRNEDHFKSVISYINKNFRNGGILRY